MLRRCMIMAGAGALVLGATATPAFAQPEPNRGRCISELARAGLIGRGTNPGQANIIAGTEGDDTFAPALFTSGPDFVCGFGGNDSIPFDVENNTNPFGEGDVFLGGDGNDSVAIVGQGATFHGGAGNDSFEVLDGGTVHGGAGDDFGLIIDRGTFNGGPGSDTVVFLFGADATFNGGDGDDRLDNIFDGTFNGGPGNELVGGMFAGTYNGEAGDDHITFMLGGTFNGGPGNDSIETQFGGTFNQD